MASIINQFRENYSIITIHGTKEVYIENFISIISLTETETTIKAKGETITLSGEKLQIEYFNKNDLKISGIINSISFKENSE